MEMLPAEQFLIDSGEAEGVIHVRSRYQTAIEATFRAAVERGTGRRVVSFASITELDPNYADRDVSTRTSGRRGERWTS